jgi:hypothetical protein
MAAGPVHKAQAQHNERLALDLLERPPFHDWAITAAFYAAVHYAEWSFYLRETHHTETSIPLGSDGRFTLSPHQWRERLLHRQLDKQSFMDYRQLKQSSETARYLSLSRPGGSSSEEAFAEHPASECLDLDCAREMVTVRLSRVKAALGVTG